MTVRAWWESARQVVTLPPDDFIERHFEEVDMSERGMDLVRVKRTDVLKKVKEGLEKHRREFDRVYAVFRMKAIQEMGERVEKATSGKRISLHFNLPVPADHTGDYERVIAMLDMSVDDVVELTKREFQRYILNDWEWAQEWEGTKSSYGVGEAD